MIRRRTHDDPSAVVRGDGVMGHASVASPIPSACKGNQRAVGGEQRRDAVAGHWAAIDRITGLEKIEESRVPADETHTDRGV